jgi:hypothetical protein
VIRDLVCVAEALRARPGKNGQESARPKPCRKALLDRWVAADLVLEKRREFRPAVRYGACCAILLLAVPMKSKSDWGLIERKGLSA